MKTTLNLALILGFITQPLFAGPGQSKLKAIASSKHSAEAVLSAGSATAAAIAPKFSADHAVLAQVMNKALLPDLWKLVFEYMSRFDPIALRTFQGHQGPVNCVAAMDKDHIITGGHDGQLILWNIRNGKIVKEYTDPISINPAIVYVFKRSDEKHFVVATQSRDGSAIQCWHKDGSATINSFSCGRLRDIALFDGASVAVIPADGQGVKHLNANNGKIESECSPAGGQETSIAQIDGEHYVVGDFGGRMHLLRKSHNSKIREFASGHNVAYRHIVRLSDNVFISCDNDSNLMLWDKNNADKIKVFNTKELGNICSILPLGTDCFITATSLGRLVFWHTDDSQPLEHFASTHNGGYRMAYVNDNHFVTAGYDGVVKLWRHSLATKLQAIMQTYKNSNSLAAK